MGRCIGGVFLPAVRDYFFLKGDVNGWAMVVVLCAPPMAGRCAIDRGAILRDIPRYWAIYCATLFDIYLEIRAFKRFHELSKDFWLKQDYTRFTRETKQSVTDRPMEGEIRKVQLSSLPIH